jgi:hypothetical protein
MGGTTKGLPDIKLLRRALTPECDRKYTQASGSLRTTNGDDMFVAILYSLGAIRTVAYTRLLSYVYWTVHHLDS